MTQALLHLIDEGGLPMERAMSARQIQTHFPDVSDQAVPSGVVGRVLAKVGLLGNAARYIQPWQVMDLGRNLKNSRTRCASA